MLLKNPNSNVYTFGKKDKSIEMFSFVHKADVLLTDKLPECLHADGNNRTTVRLNLPRNPNKFYSFTLLTLSQS